MEGEFDSDDDEDETFGLPDEQPSSSQQNQAQDEKVGKIYSYIYVNIEINKSMLNEIY